MDLRWNNLIFSVNENANQRYDVAVNRILEETKNGILLEQTNRKLSHEFASENEAEKYIRKLVSRTTAGKAT